MMVVEHNRWVEKLARRHHILRTFQGQRIPADIGSGMGSPGS